MIARRYMIFWTDDQSGDQMKFTYDEYMGEIIKGWVNEVWGFKSNISPYCSPGRLTFMMTWYSLCILRPHRWGCYWCCRWLVTYARRVMWGCSVAWMNSLHICFLVWSLCIVWHCSQVTKVFPDGLTVPRLHCMHVFQPTDSHNLCSL